jgi:S-adenosylmethionine:tRNA ribosyltransferase-isomerase
MSLNTSLFDFELPPELIAQQSVSPRDRSKLMVLNRLTGAWQHQHFYNLPEYLRSGDVLVFNTSKVFKARLVEAETEMFVLRIFANQAEVLLKPGKKFLVGSEVKFFDHIFYIETKQLDGVVIVRTNLSVADMLAFCDAHGKVPTPPYVKEAHQLDGDYQTVYAKEVGSVAAPTAGFHFTEDLLAKLKAQGVQIEHVVLHVGIGTFRPMQTNTLEEHTMHSEWVSLPAEVAERINQAKQAGRRIIAAGTTTTRVLEGVASMHQGQLVGYEGDVNIFITPGYQFKVIDGLITNFHLPKSTLLVLISAFAGRDNILTAYEEAKNKGYRFFSFGDAMLLI